MVLASKLGERVISLSLLGAPHKGDGVGSAPNLIRELGVTGWAARSQRSRLGADTSEEQVEWWTYGLKIGRASCRERVCQYVEISVVAGSVKKKKNMEKSREQNTQL